MTKIYWNCRIRFLHLHQPETGIAHDSHASCQTKTKKKIVEASINKSSRLGHKNKNFTRDYPLAIHVLFGFNQGFNIRQNLFFNSSKEMISYRHQKNPYIWVPMFKPSSCSGGHLGFSIDTKNRHPSIISAQSTIKWFSGSR